MSGSILYIHGFNSAPESKKAVQLASVMQRIGLSEQLRVPALHHHPREAMAQLQAAISELGRPLLVGSSLGGYYATYLAEQHGLNALLVNPAVSPHRHFEREAAVRLFDEAVHHCQAQTRAWSLGREERFDRAFNHVARHAFARIRNADHNILIVRQAVRLEFCPVGQ